MQKIDDFLPKSKKRIIFCKKQKMRAATENRNNLYKINPKNVFWTWAPATRGVLHSFAQRTILSRDWFGFCDVVENFAAPTCGFGIVFCKINKNQLNIFFRNQTFFHEFMKKHKKHKKRRPSKNHWFFQEFSKNALFFKSHFLRKSWKNHLNFNF